MLYKSYIQDTQIRCSWHWVMRKMPSLSAKNHSACEKSGPTWFKDYRQCKLSCGKTI